MPETKTEKVKELKEIRRNGKTTTLMMARKMHEPHILKSSFFYFVELYFIYGQNEYEHVWRKCVRKTPYTQTNIEKNIR